MTLLLWQLPAGLGTPIIECWGSRYGVQYYRFHWRNIPKVIAEKFQEQRRGNK